MSLEVKGLAEIVRDAKASIARAKTATNKLGTVSSELAATLGAVESMTSQIEAAHAELKHEMAGSNIGP
jgi:hypothetical protein